MLIIGTLLACKNDPSVKVDPPPVDVPVDSVFNQSKWYLKDGEQYPYRAQMLDDLVYNDTVRNLSKDQLLELLGPPDRTNREYLYYLVTQRKLLTWPLHTKSLVIKLTDDDRIDWMKIHQ